MNSPPEPTAKVLFRVPDEDGSADVETLWARPLGNDEYQLDNLPFFAYAVSVEDVVYAPYSVSESFPTFERVVRKSGNRTVRVILKEPAQPGNESHALLKGLIELGCDYEGANRILIAVNVPSKVELARVQQYLVDNSAEWEHADPTFDQLHRE